MLILLTYTQQPSSNSQSRTFLCISSVLTITLILSFWRIQNYISKCVHLHHIQGSFRLLFHKSQCHLLHTAFTSLHCILLSNIILYYFQASRVWSGWIVTFNQKVLMYAYNPKLICTLPIQISNRLVIYEVEMSVHPKYYSFKETLPLQLHLVYKTHFTVGQGSKLLVNWILMDTSRQHHDYSKHQSWSRDASHFSIVRWFFHQCLYH